MPELGIRNQCLFIAVYASIVLLCAATMTSQETGSLAGTVTTRYICSTCEKKGLRSFFMSQRAVHIHISKCKGCSGSDVKKISVMTRPGDVIAGGSGGMGPCPPPQHQPPGIIDIYLTYTWIISRYNTYDRYMPDLCQIYTFCLWYMSSIYQTYDRQQSVI